jgi:molybdopterin-biosynthesis enzyme MoeA-like protein
MKMAQMPEGSTELIRHNEASGQPSPFPLLKVNNIFVLPGVPKIVRSKWDAIKENLEQQFGASASVFHNRWVACLSSACIGITACAEWWRLHLGHVISV